MANTQTYSIGTDGGQVTTLAHVSGAGLAIPMDYIDSREPGKLSILFDYKNNSEVLYSTDTPINTRGPLASRFDYRNPTQGQKNLLRTNTFSILTSAAKRDAKLVTDLIKSTTGTRHQLSQLILQGFQPYDETKVYNPASPILASVRMSALGALDRPTRHIDTSNVISGIIGGTGLGKVTSTIGGLLGRAPAAPAPPRSSVASEASNGIGLSTLTSLVGGGDKSSSVMRLDGGIYDVKGLLRGKTATDAYNSYRYSRLISSSSSKGFFGRLLSGIGRYIQNNTVVGGIIPPKQPWNANYRADEKTYDYFINAGKIFHPDSNGSAGGGIIGGLLNQLGFGKKANYSGQVHQRFSNPESENKPDGNRWIISSVGNTRAYDRTNKVGKVEFDQITSDKIKTVDIQDKKYSEVIYNDAQTEESYSDQLLNYKVYTDKSTSKNFNTSQYNDNSQTNTTAIINNVVDGLKKISGANSEKYKSAISAFAGGKTRANHAPLQFSKFNNAQSGQGYISRLKDDHGDKLYTGIVHKTRQLESEENGSLPSLNLTRNSRKLAPTNDVDNVNSMGILDSLLPYNANNTVYGPDIIKFYFYDIINEKYIPFRATVLGINETNTAEWEQVEYIGRADKLFYYKGFTRNLAFNFKVVAHSIKELLPMWKRINYLTSLIRPSAYTGGNSGFIVPPMIQLTLGDIYKNHNVLIDTCNLTIPDDASWEMLPEEYNENWYYGLSKSFEWDRSKGKFAQFPMEAELNLSLKVLEKTLPRAGGNMWGDNIDDSDNFSNKMYTNLNYNLHDDLANTGVSTVL